ncbi:hypothetical protein AB204_02530 [Xenorhabdus khoisanae]|uniref:Acetyltransferase n=1 Tax=Xenorhabdus khoisanae TaxID=880157 RepID=A0A0J5FWX3_9GAMM|nr:hypothetical protein [Xenorhabdus khoisanae]KMJ46711.1 hypothetical protein AB204_02530 [Xenorhabdus khoisanae]
MKVQVITGKHPDFISKAQRIVDIYNQDGDGFGDERLEISYPETLHLIYVENVEGGVITDAWRDENGHILFHSIMFAAFPKPDRRKGFLRACIEDSDFPIETVQINSMQTYPIWKKLGFDKVGLLGMTLMLRCRDFDGVTWGQVFSENP